MNETLCAEARRLLEAESKNAGSTHRCHKHWSQSLEDRATDCSDCHKEFVETLHAGADANRFLVQWRKDATKLLGATFGLAAAEGKKP